LARFAVHGLPLPCCGFKPESTTTETKRNEKK
jgi:hypothetical protein